MKIGLKKSLLVLSAAVFFAACTPVAHKEIGEQRNILSSLEGTWKLTKATQVDEAAKAKGFIQKTSPRHRIQIMCYISPINFFRSFIFITTSRAKLFFLFRRF